MEAGQTSRVCQKCGAAFPPDAPQGLCPACLLARVCGEEPAESLDSDEGPALVSPVNRKAAWKAGASMPEGRFGDYELLEVIGRGGMGVVFKARQIRLNRLVALKMIQARRLDSPGLVQRFQMEAEAVASLHHANITAIHEIGQHDGQHYFSMDLVEGRNLAEIIASGNYPGSDFNQVARWVEKIAQAIHHAHQQGILHRDLKPSNILVDARGEPHVSDFGLARRLKDESEITLTGEILGSPAYMSPEQASGRRRVTVATDIYSLGGILYELLTGRPPFRGATPAETLHQVLHADPIRLRVMDRAIPRDLEIICLTCLEKEPSRRYASARELAEELGRFLRDEPIRARPAGPVEKTWRWVRRNPVMACLGALALFLFLLVAVGSPVAVWNIQRARELAESRAYASDMNLVQQALAANNIGRAERLLQNYQPAADPTARVSPLPAGRLGWEWRYLWRQCQSDALYTLCHQPNPISSLAVSHDGQWLAVGEQGQGRLTIWDLSSRREIARLPAGENAVHAAFSPTRPLLAFTVETGVQSSSRSDQVRLWDGQTGGILAELPVGEWCRGLAFSGDGQTLVTSTLPPDNQFTLWKVPEGTRLAAYPALRTPSSGVRFAASPDLRLAVHVAGERLRVVDLATGREQWSAAIEGEKVSTVGFSADGRVLASGVSGSEPVIRLWEAASGHAIGLLRGHEAYVTDVCFWPDGKTLASASADRTIRLWDLTRLRPVQVLHGHRHEVWRLALLPDQRTLISGGKDGTVCVWDTAVTPIARGLFTLPVAVRAWGFSPDSQSVLAFDQEGRVTRWHGPAFQRAEPLVELAPRVGEACLSADGRWIAAGFPDGRVQVWDLPNRLLAREWKVASRLVRPLHFIAQGGRLVVTLDGTDLYHEWDVLTEREVRSWRGARNGMLAAFSPDANWAFTMGRARAASLRHLASDRETDLGLESLQVWNGAFSPDGKHFAIASSLGFCRVWDTRRFGEIATLGGFLLGAHSVTFSPDNRRLAAGSNAQEAIKLWDLASQQELLTLEGRGTMFSSCAFSPDGNVLGALNSAGVLHLWRAPAWEEIAAAEASNPGGAQAR